MSVLPSRVVSKCVSGDCHWMSVLVTGEFQKLKKFCSHEQTVSVAKVPNRTMIYAAVT